MEPIVCIQGYAAQTTAPRELAIWLSLTDERQGTAVAIFLAGELLDILCVKWTICVSEIATHLKRDRHAA